MKKVTVSISEHITENFKSYVVPFSKIADLVKSKFNYSAGAFKDNYRKADNYLNYSDMIILDIDDGKTIEQARIIFEPFDYIIATTKSHQKEKNGIVCDRFRVLLPTENPINLNKTDYSKMMNEVFKDYPFVDTKNKVSFIENDFDTLPIFSTSNHLSNNYKPNIDIKWENLYEVVCSPNKLMYSAHSYKNGHRTMDNAISGFNLLILDFDNDATINEVSNYFKDYEFLIATTRSHMKEKNGKISERFRLILRLDKTLYLNKEQYSLFMKKIINSLPFKADNACVDISRMFFSSV